ncbi:MAG: N-acetylglucosamine-6-phosphate deacetylase [Desulfovibrio sp.]
MKLSEKFVRINYTALKMQMPNVSQIVIKNANFFTGKGVEYKRSLLIKGSRFVKFCKEYEIPEDYLVIDAEGLNISPGFIDCQVNGACGIPVSLDLTSSKYEQIAEVLAVSGTTRWLPTLLSPKKEELLSFPEIKQLKKSGVLGFHIEGPLISDQFRGFHPKSQVRNKLTDTEISSIVRLADECKVVLTCCPQKINALNLPEKHNIILSAGHTECDYETACEFFRSGGRAVTHAFNATPAVKARVPNVVNAAQDVKGTYISVINDGVHVHSSVVRMLKRSSASNSLFFVSDLMPAYNNPNSASTFYGKVIIEKKDKLVDIHGNLAGSNSPLLKAVKHSVQNVGIPLDESLRMATLYPAEYLGISDAFGKIEDNYIADLVAFDNQFNISFVLRNGSFVFS